MPARTREQERLPFGLIALMFAGAAVLNLAAGALVHSVVESGFEGEVPFVRSLTRISLMDDKDVDEDEQDKAQQELEEAKRLVVLDRVTDERAPEDAEFAAEFDNTSSVDTRRGLSGDQAKAQAGAQGSASMAEAGSEASLPAPTSSPSPQTEAARKGKVTRSSGSQGQGNDKQGQDHQGDAAGKAGDAALNSGRAPQDPGGTGVPAPPGGSPAPQSPTQGGAPASPPTNASPKVAPIVGGSAAALAETFGGRPTYDPTRDQKEGAENDLDTERNRYASFYNRMRQGVYQHWHPDRVMHEIDPKGERYARGVRSTRLLIRLFKDGELDRVRITQSSGIDRLDEEAVRAVRSSAPFTNPPAGLVHETSQRVRIDFGFTLHPSGEFTVIRND